MSSRARFGNFDLHRRLAVGGMGEIYLATRVGEPRRQLVVKILLRTYRDRPDFVDMFKDEARIGMSLAHRNIVGVQEVGTFEDTPFIVMEYIRGENLRSVLRRMKMVDDRVAPELAVRIGIDVALALEHAHRARDEEGIPLKLVHRDLSPDNILLSTDGEVKILDFGISKAAGRSTQTQYGVLKGKGQYMSPEQARGEEVDGRSDLFALAVVLLETICGEKRIQVEDGMVQIVAARDWIPYGPSERIRGLPVELDAVLLKALQTDPDERWSTADEFAAALTRLLRSGKLPRAGENISGMLQRLFPDPDDQDPTGEGAPGPEASPAQVPGKSSEDPTQIRARAVRAEEDVDDRPTNNIAMLGRGRQDEEPEPAEQWSDDDGDATSALERLPPPGRATPRQSAVPTQPGARNLASDDDATRSRGNDFEIDQPATAPPGSGPVSAASAASPVPRGSGPVSAASAASPVPRGSGPVSAASAASPVPRGSGPVVRPGQPRSLAPPLDPVWAKPERPRDDRPTFVDPETGHDMPQWGPATRKNTPGKHRLRTLFLLGVLGLSSAGAAFTWRGRLPPVVRGPLDDLAGRPPVRQALDQAETAIELYGGQIGLFPPLMTPTPEPAVVFVKPKTPVLVRTTAGVASAATPSAMPTRSPPAPTPTAVARLTPHPAPTHHNAVRATTVALVQVASKPAGLEIVVDGVPSGKKTPGTMLLAPGSHVLALEAPGYKPWSYAETFRPGDTLHLEADLQQAP